MKPLNDLLGKRFGRLKVIAREPNRRTPNGSHRTMWKCKCDCGNETIVSACSLTRKAKDKRPTESCGCLRLEAVASKDWLGVEFRRYRKHNLFRGRKKREVSFQLTQKEFGEMILKNCHYCGSEPNMKSHVGGKLRNGIDRIVNEIGYTSGNVVTCCKACNNLKGNLSVQDFLDSVKRIAKHQNFLTWGQFKK